MWPSGYFPARYFSSGYWYGTGEINPVAQGDGIYIRFRRVGRR
jgi:hypothetical protein